MAKHVHGLNCLDADGILACPEGVASNRDFLATVDEIRKRRESQFPPRPLGPIGHVHTTACISEDGLTARCGVHGVALTPAVKKFADARRKAFKRAAAVTKRMMRNQY